MSRLVVLECANCSLHATVECALSETVVTVSLSTVPRLSLLPAAVHFANGEVDVWGRAGGIAADGSRPPCVRSRSRRDKITLPK